MLARKALLISVLAAAASPAALAAVEPLDAAALLARARAVNEKCKFLNAEETDRLGNLATAAELVAADKFPVEDVRAALDKGKAQGAASACDASNRADVANVYSAASEAMNEALGERKGPKPLAPAPSRKAAAAPIPAPKPVRQLAAAPVSIAPQPAPAPSVQKPAPIRIAPQPQPRVAAVQPPAPQAPRQAAPAEEAPAYAATAPRQLLLPPPAPEAPPARSYLARLFVSLEGEPEAAALPAPQAHVPQPEPGPAAQAPAGTGLARYSQRSAAYLAGISCRELSGPQALALWRSIAAEHSALLERKPPAAIVSAQRTAQAMAAGMPCGPETARFVGAVAGSE